MQKIKMINPIAELDGDEMTRVLWQMIKDELLTPFVELNTEYYDLSLTERDRTNDQITRDAGNAIKRLGVGVKCATITSNADRVKEYNLKNTLPSPNATLRAILDGTVFRASIITDRVKPYVSNWRKPITIARHAYGDIYKAVEYRVPEAGKAEMVFTNSDGKEMYRETIHEFKGAGLLQAMHNKCESIESFAEACFKFALDRKQDLWFSAKDTISKQYDGTFRQIFQDKYETKYKPLFEEAGLEYFYTLIDDAVARVIRSEGGFIWATKNYDGDVMSDMISTAFGSLAMMTSVLVSPDGCFEYEAAHGTVTRHYYRYLKGETTSTNPVATIFAWTGALKKRGELDGQTELMAFAENMEKATLATINSGVMTKDLAVLAGADAVSVSSAEFLKKIRENYELTA